MDAEIKNFKKIKKVLKDALTTEKDKNSILEKEVDKLKTRNTEMETEIKEKE
jgi:cell division protein FtsB